MRHACASVLALLLAAPASAQNAPVPLSESEFIEKYQNAEPRFAGLSARIAQAQARVFDKRALRNPKLFLQREAAGGVGENVAGLSWSLDLGGRGASVDSARADVTATEQRVAHAQLVLLFDALDRYYNVVLMRERLALLQNARAPLAETVKLVGAKAAAGESAGYERDRLELELAQHDERIAQAQTELSLARLTIARLLGTPNLGVSVSGTLTVARPAALPSMVDQARTQRTDLQAARTRSRASSLAMTAAGRWWVPSLEVSGGVKTVTVGGATDTGYTVALNIGLPLFDRRQAARQSALAADREARASIKHLELAIPGTVRRLHTSLIARLDHISRLEKQQVPRANRLVRRATLLYREGEGQIVELVDAHRASLQVGLRRLELQHQAKRAELALQREVGSQPAGVGK